MGILEFFKSNILGQLGDQHGSLWIGEIFFSKKFHLLDYYSLSLFIEPKQNFNEYLFRDLYNFIYISFSYFLGGILAYNILTILFLSLNSISLYFLLKSLNIKKDISLVFSFFFSLIPYFYVHYEHHTLLIIFPSILIINNLLKSDFNLKIQNLLYVSFLYFIQIHINLYLGYFLSLYLGIWFLILFFKDRNINILKYFSIILILTATFFCIFNFKLVSNFFYPETSNVKYYLPNNTKLDVSTFPYEKNRSLEEFLYFSSRPWYYFLYHTSHPFFGQSTKDIIKYFSEYLDIWIFKNHFPAEHNASFIGYTLILIISFGIYKKELFKVKILSYLFWLNIFLIILTMPPVFIIGSIQIYSPSYLIYMLFPMFRTTARLALFIQLNFFIISAYLVNLYTKNFDLKKRYLAVFSLVVLLFLDYSFNYKFMGVSRYQETSEYLLKNNSDKKFIAVYPAGIRIDFLLNMTTHESPIFNPSGFFVRELNFESGEFTKKLDTCENLKFFKNLNGGYLVIKDFQNQEFINISKLDTIFYSQKENITIKSIDKVENICK